ncbi:hypothetical protein ACHAXT_011785 [Thalassiosira profunda]
MSQAQGYPLAKLLASVEKRESPLHGEGLFAVASVQPGEYSILPNDPKILDIVETFGYSNAALMPEDILLRCDDGEGGEDNVAAADDFVARLAKFRGGFETFVVDEQSKANVSTAFRPKEEGADVVVKVLREIKEGEELLRPYGTEWLSIKYYALKHYALLYREKMMKHGGSEDREMIFAIDVNSLCASVWEFKTGIDATNAQMGRYLSKKEGKELVVVSPDEINSLSNVLGLTALEYLDKGDEEFDFTWRHNFDHLRHDYPRRVIHPASFPSWLAKKKKKSTGGSPAKKRKHQGGGVAKLKHGAFDVYRMA